MKYSIFSLVTTTCVDEEVNRYVEDEHFVAVSFEVLADYEHSVDDLLEAGDSLWHTELDRISVIEVDSVSHLYLMALHVLCLNEVTSAVTL